MEKLVKFFLKRRIFGKIFLQEIINKQPLIHRKKLFIIIIANKLPKLRNNVKNNNKKYKIYNFQIIRILFTKQKKKKRLKNSDLVS